MAIESPFSILRAKEYNDEVKTEMKSLHNLFTKLLAIFMLLMTVTSFEAAYAFDNKDTDFDRYNFTEKYEKEKDPFYRQRDNRPNYDDLMTSSKYQSEGLFSNKNAPKLPHLQMGAGSTVEVSSMATDSQFSNSRRQEQNRTQQFSDRSRRNVSGSHRTARNKDEALLRYMSNAK